METRKKKRLLRGLAVGAAVFAAGCLLSALKALDGIEAKSWDLRQRAFADPARADKRIVLILIDQQSLDVYAEQGYTWPWMREMYRPMIEYCRRGGARAFFIDMFFSEPSVFGEEDDRRLAEAAAEAGNVFLPAFFSTEENAVPPDRGAVLEKFAAPRTASRPGAVRDLRSVLLPLPELMTAVHGIGDVQMPPDSDGIYRRIPLFTRLEGRVYPSLPLALAEYAVGGAVPGVPMDSQGRMLIRFLGPTGSYPTYSAAAVINSFVQAESGEIPQLPAETFRDKIVMVGGSAPGILDLKSTPLSRICPGTEIQAAALDNLLNRDFLRPAPFAMSVAWLALIAFLSGVVFSSVQKTGRIMLSALGIFALPAAGAGAGFAAGVWLPFAVPETAALTAFAASLVLNYNLEGRQRRFVRKVFQHYLSGQVIDRVLENPSLLKLGGERRDVSSFFSDVAGFTTISEGLSPEDLVHLLNRYLSAMTDILLDSGGTLDKYEGDAIIAFWNAPLDQPDHALRAVRSALKCQEKLAELRPEFEREFGHGLRMRIGLNTGPAVVGNMGSANRFDYTAMGDTINLAARLEGAGKIYSVPILIGETTFAAVEDIIAARRVDLIRVVGKTKPVHVYEPLGEKAALDEKRYAELDLYHRALGYYRARRWEEALKLFRELKDDSLARLYTGRATRLKADPPGEDWDGVFDLTSK
jgi:adenylate cyclase